MNPHRGLMRQQERCECMRMHTPELIRLASDDVPRYPQAIDRG